MKILVFAPHPDDAILGCGGTIAKHIKNKQAEVTIAYMTSGGRNGKTEIREREAKEGAKMLGVSRVVFFRGEDGNIKDDNITLFKIANQLKEVKPDIIFIPHSKDGHIDHMRTHSLVVASLDRIEGKVLCYEVWRPLQKIDCIEDISRFISLKIKALTAHQSQLKTMRIDDAIRGLNRFRGVTTQKGNYVECFEVLGGEDAV